MHDCCGPDSKAHSHSHTMETEAPDVLNARFEELSALEQEFEDIEAEIIRKAEALQAPLYKKRADFVAKIPHFWPLVFEQAPPEIDNFIQPSDSKVFAESLDTFEVLRFELDDPKGSPRSFALKFGFNDNEYFEDKVLEKKFWYRKTKDWAGLVSEPVKIHWKKEKDLTGGLTDAACKLNEVRKKLSTDTSSGAARKEEAKTKEYKRLAQKIETSVEASVSFFGLFAFVSGYRWVSEQESEQAVKEEKERFEKIRQGEKVDEEDDDEEDPQDYQEIEVFPGGDEVATIIAEDMWPNAIKYYRSTFDEDEDDEELSDLDVMDLSDEDDEDDDQEPVDIRALVGKGRKSGPEPPAKKQRKA
ncbi:NAP family protein [Clathrospora elynae]|uniref:NAP family protein n=1 Tax=Clathrospora elynae TaxID=706981 RepID=A0A6A5SN97_9PLEO|nr:NAP family protein [Clathrospora elynae]